jgi:hypothetical protein
MRGTLHVIAADDARGLLALSGAGMKAAFAKRRGELGLDDHTLRKVRAVTENVLGGGQALGRAALLAAIDRRKLAAEPHRGYHMLFCLAADGIVVQGPPGDDGEPAYVLAEAWLPRTAVPHRDELLAAAARRFFASHGPATIADLQRWLKLSVKDAKAAVAAAAPSLESIIADGVTYWLDPATPGRVPRDVGTSVLALPGFDELILGYADRTHTLAADHADKIVPGGNGIFLATIVADGRVIGTWKRAQKPKGIVVTAAPFGRFTAAHAAGFARAAAAYGRFVGNTVKIA